MAANNRYITNAEAAPLVETDIFHNDLNKKFAIVSFGLGLRENDELFTGYLRLRANVYVHQTRFLSEDVIRPDGTEIDEDDERSSHFLVLENRLGHAAAVGCIRLIEKSKEHPEPLPIEQFFPEAFEDQEANAKSLEVSRFISCIDSKALQLVAVMELFKSGLARVEQGKLGPTYGVVEEELEQSLTYLGAPPRRIAEPQYVEEYNTSNVGVEIDTGKMVEAFGPDLIHSLDVSEGSVRYWGRVKDETLDGIRQIA